jgi:hypothetical protein
MFLCIENNAVVSVLNYEPNVPASIEVIKLSPEEDLLLNDSKYQFDVGTKKFVLKDSTTVEAEAAKEISAKNVQYLQSTDWMVLRHIRQHALGVNTSLTEQEYLDLEAERNIAASKV